MSSRTADRRGPGAAFDLADLPASHESDPNADLKADLSTPPDAARAEGASTEEAPNAKAKPARSVRRRRRPVFGAARWQWDAPSWGVSLMVHAGVLLALAMIAVGERLAEELSPIDAAMIDTSLAEQQEEELLHLLDPVAADPREVASGPFSMAGTAAPSRTPNIRSETAEVSESRSLAGLIDIVAPTVGTELLPPSRMLNKDLGRGGRISGDVTRATSSYDEALDQLAREILAHLKTSRVTVLWMFDESGSMKDDQRTIRDKFDRVAGELRRRVPAPRRGESDLDHAVIGFGRAVHDITRGTTPDVDVVRRAIDRLPEDESGQERTMRAVAEALGRYNRAVDEDRKILLVLVTDESGDDGGLVEEARTRLVNRGVTTYVLGRQAMFGYPTVRLRYVDPVTNDVYWPRINRGPEAAGLEQLQWDGLHRSRWDEQPSGFAPFELARLVEETGGIYFLLPNEEELRRRRGAEAAYSMATLKEFVPSYGPRNEYNARVQGSPMRRALARVVYETQDEFGFRHQFPAGREKLGELSEAIAKQYPEVEAQLAVLLELERALRALREARDTEPDRRWRANYDLMLAMIVAYQVKAYEYRACLKEMIALGNQGKLLPRRPGVPGKDVPVWDLRHSRDKKAPASETEKKYAEATRLLERVIADHPNTPWADLARITLSRGLGVSWHEEHHHPDRAKRAELVPKY